MFKKAGLIPVAFIIVIFCLSSTAWAHCEIPCGIYDDAMRIELLREHVTTMEKSMNKITELETNGPQETNQIVRWINNKEDHANKIQDIVSQYFLHQRIKPVASDNEELHKKYVTHLKLLHEILVYAMKAKQTTDLQYIEKLRDTVDKFENAYFHSHDH